MSGGALGYLQNLDGQELLDQLEVPQSLEYMARQLDSYGEVGAQAAVATRAVKAQVVAAREHIAQLVKELGAMAAPLSQVWKEADYHASLDSGKDNVVQALLGYNQEP